MAVLLSSSQKHIATVHSRVFQSYLLRIKRKLLKSKNTLQCGLIFNKIHRICGIYNFYLFTKNITKSTKADIEGVLGSKSSHNLYKILEKFFAEIIVLTKKLIVKY